jgi:hypothetical protein
VGREVRSQLPAPFEQRAVGNAVHPQGAQIADGQLGASLGEVTRRGHSSPRRHHFDVDEMGSDEAVLDSEAAAGTVSIVTIVAESRDEDASVDNDHRVSRSARTALAAALKPALPPARPPARSSNSSSVGVWASAMS